MCPSVCHTFLHICNVHSCDVIMYLLSHQLALRVLFGIKLAFSKTEKSEETGLPQRLERLERLEKHMIFKET